MALSDDTVERAAAMGRRAGEAFRDTGIPSPNPFEQDREPELAQAWRRAYFAATAHTPGV